MHIHVASTVQAYLQAQQVQTLPLPAFSLDLSPTECQHPREGRSHSLPTDFYDLANNVIVNCFTPENASL